MSQIEHLPSCLKIAVLTISDYCYHEKICGPTATDISKKIYEHFDKEHMVQTIILPDNLEVVKKHMVDYTLEYDILFTVGGTRCSYPVAHLVTNEIIDEQTDDPLLKIFNFIQTNYKMQNMMCGLKTNMDRDQLKRCIIINFPYDYKDAMQHYDDIIETLPIQLRMLTLISNCKIVKRISTSDLPQLESKYNSFQIDDARDLIKYTLKAYMVRAPKSIRTMDAAGHVLFSDFVCTKEIKIPAYSISDGYACISDDNSKELVVRELKDCKSLKWGECVKIKVRDVLPEFADCIVQLKDVCIENAEDGTIKLIKSPKKHDLIVPMLHYNVGDIIYGQDKLIKGFALALINSFSDSIKVFVKPSIGLIQITKQLMRNTSGELKQQMAYSNVMLATFFRKNGIKCTDYDVILNEKFAFITAITNALRRHEILVLTFDYDDEFAIEYLLEEEFYADIIFNEVNLKCSKKTIFAHCTFNCVEKFIFVIFSDDLSHIAISQLLLYPNLMYWAGVDDYQFSKMNVTVNEDIPLYSQPQYLRASVTFTVLNNPPLATLTKCPLILDLSNGTTVNGIDVLLEIPASDVSGKCITKGTMITAIKLKN